jgi:hypothetical protein
VVNVTSTDTSASGTHVVEGLARGQAIPVDSDFVTAFIAPTPRGPVDRAVEISTSEQFEKIFDLPSRNCRLSVIIRDFFANGGTNAVVVRISGTNKRSRIYLPGPAGNLVLEACNPGALEYLRAAVDYDGIEPGVSGQFNLVIQRLREPDSAWVETQEYFRRISIDPASRDYVGYVLNQSTLAMLVNEAPTARPLATCKSNFLSQPEYVDAERDNIEQPAPTDYDLIGSGHMGTGLNALEHISDIGQVCLLSGSDGGPGPIALLAADNFCRLHQAILLIEPPAEWRDVNDPARDAARRVFSSPNAVTWFPGLQVRKPDNEFHSVSAMGAVAAALVAANRPPGVTSPETAPVFLRSSGLQLTCSLGKADVQRLRRMGINTLTLSSQRHIQLQGNTTLTRNDTLATNWQELDRRFQVLFILRRIRNATRWTFFHESNADIWSALTDQIERFLAELHVRSMLAGQHASLAFYVKCDRDTNQGLAGSTGEVSFIVGFALDRPGEYLAFRFQCSHGDCRVVELGWDSGLQLAG